MYIYIYTFARSGPEANRSNTCQPKGSKVAWNSFTLFGPYIYHMSHFRFPSRLHLSLHVCPERPTFAFGCLGPVCYFPLGHFRLTSILCEVGATSLPEQAHIPVLSGQCLTFSCDLISSRSLWSVPTKNIQKHGDRVNMPQDTHISQIQHNMFIHTPHKENP